jgi:hypothetical protein
MNRSIDPKRPATGKLHRSVYLALAVLAVWLVVSAWGFAGTGYSDLALAVVSVFVFFAVAVPLTLARIWRNGRPPGTGQDDQRFKDWASGGVDIWRGRLEGKEAASQVLLPIAAVALGMTAFAIVFRLVT